MKKKLLALTAVVALAGVVMVGCGSSKKETEAATEAATTAVTEATNIPPVKSLPVILYLN